MPQSDEIRFSRYRGLLYFAATRVLGGRKEAEEAVENCLFIAACHPPRFDSEGAFRSWLLRILIDEALEILHRVKNTASPERVFPDMIPCGAGSGR